MMILVVDSKNVYKKAITNLMVIAFFNLFFRNVTSTRTSNTFIIPCKFTDDEAAQLVRHIQDAGTEVVEAKAGNGSATLAMAAAAYRFVNAVVRGLLGEENVVECAYVEGGSQHSRFFSQPMRLGKEGWYKVLPYGPLTQAEKDALEAMLPTLRDEIRMGEEFVLKPE
jgi:malate dehydrogenase